ncbi:unnamed protein product [Paramecium sonneborni]|uniref:Uncharacterized protein n=1 Tax=Paramecium sonneborni TaxID=65129 RepID=A0A8S1N6H5_9CILI|nr:unnamed protein product [Paramecium sonneborni]
MSKKFKKQGKPVEQYFLQKSNNLENLSHGNVLQTKKKIKKPTNNEMKKFELLQEIKKSKSNFSMFLQFRYIKKQEFEPKWMLLSFVDKNLQPCTVFVGQNVDYLDNFQQYSWYQLTGLQVAQNEYQNNKFIKLNLKSGTIRLVDQQQLQDEVEISIYLNQFNELNPKKPKNQYYNFLVAILKIHQKEKVFSERCQKFYDLIKIDTIDQADQMMQVSLWNEFQQLELTPNELVLFQNVQYKELDGFQYFQTVEKKSIITQNQDILNQLPNYDQMREKIERSQFKQQLFDLRNLDRLFNK